MIYHHAKIHDNWFMRSWDMRRTKLGRTRCWICQIWQIKVIRTERMIRLYWLFNRQYDGFITFTRPIWCMNSYLQLIIYLNIKRKLDVYGLFKKLWPYEKKMFLPYFAKFRARVISTLTSAFCVIMTQQWLQLMERVA